MMQKKHFLLLLFLFFFLILQRIILIPSFLLLSFSLLFLFSILFYSKEKMHHRFRYDKTQNFFLLLLFYFIFYFLSGLIFGYSKSPYVGNLSSIFQSIFYLLLPIILEEYVRYKLLATSKCDKITIFLVSFLFSIFSLSSLPVLSDITSIISMIMITFLPLFCSQLLCTYLCVSAGYHLSTYYRLFFVGLSIFCPFLPNYPEVIRFIMGLLLPYLFFQVISSCECKRERRISIRRTTTSNFSFCLLLLFLLFFLGFAVGLFRYQPIAVMSDSMKGVFSRGDAVVIEKVSQEDCRNLKLYDIIYFKVNDMFILHRVVSIEEKDGIRRYKTKGDFNLKEDPWIIADKDIYGKVLFSVPYVGYPSVLVSELLFSEEE